MSRMNNNGLNHIEHFSDNTKSVHNNEKLEFR